jgi:hypothetical protein
MARDILDDGRYYGQSHNIACKPILKRLGTLKEDREKTDGEMDRLVYLAWSRGATWEDIGGALGLSRQGAHRKYVQIVKEQMTKR